MAGRWTILYQMRIPPSNSDGGNDRKSGEEHHLPAEYVIVIAAVVTGFSNANDKRSGD